jgi:hypothetical protein
MTLFLVQVANNDNPQELMTADEVGKMEDSFMEFDGFCPYRIVTTFKDAEIKKLKEYLANVAV